MDLLDDDGLLNIGRRRTTDPRQAIQEERGRWREAPERNPDLDAWANDRKGAGKAGSCHLCDRPGRNVCGSCQQATCAAHTWVMLGVCRACATEDRMRRWHAKKQASDANWLEGP